MARIVITGLGIVSPVGNNTQDFWNAFNLGSSCFSEIDGFSTDPYGAHRAATVREFTPLQPPKSKQPWTRDRAIQFALVAARQALADAEIKVEEANQSQIGVVLGSTLACLDLIRELDTYSANPKGIDPLLFPDSAPSAPSCRMSIQLGPSGFNFILSNGASSGLDAIHYGALAIQLGRANIVLAGGVEELTRETFIYYAAMGDLAGKAPCLPFGRHRAGSLLGEGSAILVLEELEHARSRNAPILAEIAGYGTCSWSDGESADARPCAAGEQAAMQGALDEADLEPAELGCIFANANGSVCGDATEVQAITSLYGASPPPATVALKSLVGELNSASGALQAGACALALKHKVVPPVVVPDEVDPLCALSRRAEPVSQAFESGLINAFSRTPGCSTSSSLVLRAV
jgi:3-oxoacyl-[acyl-carrier-protein] synthase II